MHDEAKVKNVTAAVINKNGKILIAKRKKGSRLELKWEFPGGKIESNETPEQCLERELEEEFGIKTKTGGHIVNSLYSYKDFTINLMAYHSTYISGDYSLQAHEEIMWVQPNHLKSFDFCEADLPIVTKLLEKTNE
jgi:8-oxo-dGTP diphosphatase